MKKIILLGFLIFLALTSCVSKIKIHSEYYENKNAKFKGTIIFENGSGTDISEWTNNQEFFNCAKQLGPLFLYDRSGLGNSQPDYSLSAQNPLTAHLVSNKLQALLQEKKISPPYIFVAHSYGAIYSGLFILKNPNIVSGALFVDPVPRRFNFSDKITQKYQKGLTEAQIQNAKYMYNRYPGSEVEVIYQLLGFQQSQQSLERFGNIHDRIPIVIMSSTDMQKDHPLKEDWYTSQKQWLNKNPKSKIIRLDSDHFVQISKPQEVCDELKYVLSNVQP